MLPKALAAKWLQEQKLGSSEEPVSSTSKKSLKRLVSKGAAKRVSIKKSRRSIIDTAETSSVTEFDEEIQQIGMKYNLDSNSMKNALDGLMTFIASKKSKNDLFGDEAVNLYLQINGIKVPKSHPSIARIPLKHSYYSAESDICLIVPDVKGIRNKNHDEHVDHYEKILSQKGVNNIKKIMTFHELRTEYETYELKHRLVELYDIFLVDGRISGKTVHKCGKIFYKAKKIPTAIKINTKVKANIEVALKKTPLYLHSKGDSFRLKIGHSKMDSADLVENIFYVIKGLDAVFPGGFGNIRSLLLSGSRGIKIPVYMTLKNKNEVTLSDVVKNPVEEFTGELSTKLNTHVKVKSTGEVTVIKVDDGDVEGQKKQNTSSIKKQKLEKHSSPENTSVAKGREKAKTKEGKQKQNKQSKKLNKKK